MIKLWSIAGNTFTQTIRQPIFLILVMVTFAAILMQVPIAGWTVSKDYHATDQKLLENVALSTVLFFMVLLCAFCASSVITREIDDRTALTVISKPVSRALFVLGKFLGVGGAVTAGFYLCAIAYLMAVRHGVMSAAADPYDMPVITLGLGSIVLAMIIGMAGNYVFGWHMSSTAIWSSLVLLTLSMGILTVVGKGWTSVPPGYDRPAKVTAGQVKVQLQDGIDRDKFKRSASLRGFEFNTLEPAANTMTLRHAPNLSGDEAVAAAWKLEGVVDAGIVVNAPVINAQLLIGVVLMYMAVLVLTAIAVAVSTRLGQVPTLLVVFLVFVAGSMQPMIAAKAKDLPALYLLAWAVPNLTYFYALDAFSMGKTIPLNVVAQYGGYCLCYMAGALFVGLALFQTRQLESQETTSSLPGLVGVLAWVGRVAALALAVAAIAVLSLLLTPGGESLTNALIGIGMLLAGAATWLLWGHFGRGKRWSYFVVAAVTLAELALAAMVYFVPSLREQFAASAGRVYLVIATAAAIVTAIILAMPGTRRHFRPVKVARFVEIKQTQSVV